MCKLASRSFQVASFSHRPGKEKTLFQSLLTSCCSIELLMFPFGKPVFLSVSMVKGKVSDLGAGFDFSDGRVGTGRAGALLVSVTVAAVVH